MRVSDWVIAARSRELLQSSDLNTITIKMLIQKLQKEFDLDLSDRKSFIKNEVILFQKDESGNNEEEEDRCDDPVEDPNTVVTNGSDLNLNGESDEFIGKHSEIDDCADDDVVVDKIFIDYSLESAIESVESDDSRVVCEDLCLEFKDYSKFNLVDVEGGNGSSGSKRVQNDECLDEPDEVISFDENLFNFSHEVTVKSEAVEFVNCEAMRLEFKEFSSCQLIEMECETNVSSGIGIPTTEKNVKLGLCDDELVEYKILEVKRGRINQKIKSFADHAKTEGSKRVDRRKYSSV
ncbi:hypothetical protein Tsubulata_021446 [Turnera subulata]|uniref:DEK-C domain-containing protein n=1 Tax=Turnera subulata TaxID=218843 RepID=A0A9Q0F2V0_9ROSI|nr:hypothetical protein Tsubulata_021446 [Turnera subulata]